MPAQPRQRSFSAKSKPEPQLGPPRKQKQAPGVREYLRPDEVDAMVQAARKSGRHRVRDAAIILIMFRHGLRTAGAHVCLCCAALVVLRHGRVCLVFAQFTVRHELVMRTAQRGTAVVRSVLRYVPPRSPIYSPTSATNR